ncbi:THAP-type domain-containing protein [Aphis craccivora]|uniref:THAP-type domain-containing protein n=1 Tax=Aphis craccivora TaxID=307492 RepID=A0A6G0Y757_APHCR|nr:THAP-type domain-containing protein [Aphis craccivora]
MYTGKYNKYSTKIDTFIKRTIKWSSIGFETWFTECLSHLFTPTQIELLLRPNHKVFLWTPEDISSAISLRSISTKYLLFNLSTLGLSTLRQWVSNFQVEPGLLTNVLICKLKDVVENLFSFLKGMAGSASNSITIPDFKYWWYILGKKSNFVFTKNNNSENDLEEHLLNNSNTKKKTTSEQ